MIWLCGTQHSGSFEQTGLGLDRLKGSTLDFPVPVVFNNVNFKTTVQMLLIIYSLDLMSKVKHCSTIEARFTKKCLLAACTVCKNKCLMLYLLTSTHPGDIVQAFIMTAITTLCKSKEGYSLVHTFVSIKIHNRFFIFFLNGDFKVTHIC